MVVSSDDDTNEEGDGDGGPFLGSSVHGDDAPLLLPTPYPPYLDH